jgi:hypothetical protein
MKTLKGLVRVPSPNCSPFVAFCRNSSIEPYFTSCFKDMGPKYGTKNFHLEGRESSSRSLTMADLASANVDDELEGSEMKPTLVFDLNAKESSSADVSTSSFRQILQKTSMFSILGDVAGEFAFGILILIGLLLIGVLLIGGVLSPTNDSDMVGVEGWDEICPSSDAS